MRTGSERQTRVRSSAEWVSVGASVAVRQRRRREGGPR